MPSIRQVLPIAASATVLGSLLLPWFYGTSDGVALTIPGWETEPVFTGTMVLAALVLFGGGFHGRQVQVAVAALVCIGLTISMLPRGETYSGYHFGPGGFIALAAALVALWTPVRRSWATAREARAGRRQPPGSGAREEAR